MSFTKKIVQYPLESIFSFLLRIANCNYVGFLDIWRMCKTNKKHDPSLNDIVTMIFYPTNLIDLDLLSYYTGLTPTEFLDLTFFNLLMKFKSSGLISDSRCTCGILHKEYHFCPQCLMDRPFHSLLWSIKDIQYCTTHHSYLQNHCVRCKSKIKLKELSDLSYCPYCGESLTSTKIKSADLDDDFIKRQEWYINSYTFLIKRSDDSISSQDLGLKLLYILNEYCATMSKETILKSLGKNAYMLPTLLQHARGTLSQNRILNLPFVLETLYKAKSTIQQLFNLKVPEEFFHSVTDKPVPIINRMKCKAPWCKKTNGLIKTGVSFRRTDRGIFKYYMVCQNCGCQYALDMQGTLVERTKFISIYTFLKTVLEKTISLKTLSLKSDFTVDELLRGIAFFDSRGIFQFDNYHVVFDNEKLQTFLYYIQSNYTIKSIRKLNIWESYFEFLYYRYHEKILIHNTQIKRK